MSFDMFDGKIIRARKKLWERQIKLNSFPFINIGINDIFWMNLNYEQVFFDVPELLPEPFLHFYMDDYDFLKALHREENWNNLEEMFTMKVNRVPNIYIPAAHTLMSFFHI